MLTVVLGMLEYGLMPTTPALRVAHVGNWACEFVGMNNW
jgi:hypothetical protein